MKQLTEIKGEEVKDGTKVLIGSPCPGDSWKTPFWGIVSGDRPGGFLVEDSSGSCHSVNLDKIEDVDNSDEDHQTPEQQIAAMETLAGLVVDGVSPSLLVLGRAGLGKTHRIREVLRKMGLEKDKDYKFIKGRSTPMGLYKILYNHSDETIIFDDCDSVLRIKEGVDILKAALDSYDEREISYYSPSVTSAGMEESFVFTGKIIFISNLSVEDVDPAVRNRGWCVNINMTNTEAARLMESVLPHIEKAVSMVDKEEVLMYLKEVAERMSDFSLRTLIRGIKLQQRVPNWKEMILHYA